MATNRWAAGAGCLMVILVLGACQEGDGGGGGGGTADAGTEAVITIQDLTFSPEELRVAPGTTVRVLNLDTVPHSVTSQSAPGQYQPGAVNGVSFDTGTFIAGEKRFTLPAGAPSGTVVPYFCIVHKGSMRNEARITLQ